MTPRQRQLLDALQTLTVDGVSPTYDQLCEHLGLASKSGIFRLVEGLVRLGYVRRVTGCRRTLEVLAVPDVAFTTRLADLSDATFTAVVGAVRAERARRRGLAA